MIPIAIAELLTVALLLLVLDAGWLTANAAFHRQVFAVLQGSPLRVRIWAAVGAYTLLIVAVWFFAVRPTETVAAAAGHGALLGLCLYGVYDFTNLATLTKYPLSYALPDIAWGTLLCAAVAAGARALC